MHFCLPLRIDREVRNLRDRLPCGLQRIPEPHIEVTTAPDNRPVPGVDMEHRRICEINAATIESTSLGGDLQIAGRVERQTRIVQDVSTDVDRCARREAHCACISRADGLMTFTEPVKSCKGEIATRCCQALHTTLAPGFDFRHIFIIIGIPDTAAWKYHACSNYRTDDPMCGYMYFHLVKVSNYAMTESGNIIPVHVLSDLVFGHGSPGSISIIDCRFMLSDPGWGRMQYLKSHIHGALYAHLDEDLSGTVIKGVTGRHPLPEVHALVKRLEQWGIGNDTLVVAYDQSHGGIAARLWWLLKWLGHEKVAVLDGGWQAWVDAGYPVDDAAPTPEAATFIPRITNDTVLTTAEVEQGVKDGSLFLVDARERIRYHGIEEPIDPVAGHIPGAVNLPYTENLDPEGHWKSPEVLRARLRAVIPEHTEPVFYCGSGVTACHDLLAYAHAGLGEARLYAGSWMDHGSVKAGRTKRGQQ